MTRDKKDAHFSYGTVLMTLVSICQKSKVKQKKQKENKRTPTLFNVTPDIGS